jgi:hypothetical protein
MGRHDEVIVTLLMLVMLLLVLLRCDIAKVVLPWAWAGYALLLRFSHYMLLCGC